MTVETWTVPDGARLCRVSERTVRRWCEDGWCEAYREGREWRFTLKALMVADAKARMARQRRIPLAT